MNKTQYTNRDFHLCMELLNFLEDEMDYRMCDKVSSHTSNFHKEFPQRGDTTITNFIVSIKRVGLEKMKSDVSYFLKEYEKKLKQQNKWNNEKVFG